MEYSFEVSEELNKIFEKLAKKDKTTFESINTLENSDCVHFLALAWRKQSEFSACSKTRPAL